MEERSEARKLPRGERCTQCGSRKYYIEDGLRFCAANGHQIEGFMQYDIGDLEDSGRMGVVVRRDKEIREREKKQLTGLEGKSLYLEALQLVLRSQLLWLIRDKGHKEELETVVRDLWDLRIRGFGSLVPEENTGDEKLEVFSSQPQSDESTGEMRPKSVSLSWDPDRGSEWPMPRMVETLSLCYLGCLLLRIPTRIGEFFGWANGGNIPYKRIYYELPQEMQDRMPSAYTRVLKLPLHTPLEEDELHYSILHLASGFNHNYDLAFPNLNELPMLVDYGKQLSLPVETVRTTQALISALECSFQLPISKSRIFPVDIPEMVLVALFTVATKLLFPFQENRPPFLNFAAEGRPRLKWKQWIDSIDNRQSETAPSRPKGQFQDMTADKLISMTDSELDGYFSYVSSLTDKKNENPITQFFPIEQPPPLDMPVREPTESELDERARETLEAAMQTSHKYFEKEGRSKDDRSVYEAFRAAEDLSPTAKSFYTAIASLAGLRLQTLVRAVYTLEQRIIVWQRQKRRA